MIITHFPQSILKKPSVYPNTATQKIHMNKADDYEIHS